MRVCAARYGEWLSRVQDDSDATKNIMAAERLQKTARADLRRKKCLKRRNTIAVEIRPYGISLPNAVILPMEIGYCQHTFNILSDRSLDYLE